MFRVNLLNSKINFDSFKNRPISSRDSTKCVEFFTKSIKISTDWKFVPTIPKLFTDNTNFVRCVELKMKKKIFFWKFFF